MLLPGDSAFLRPATNIGFGGKLVKQHPAAGRMRVRSSAPRIFGRRPQEPSMGRGSSMRAVVYAGAGGPEVITLGEVPRPEVHPGHIRVRVRAAGLNRADLLQRRGNYPAPPGWPADIPGMEYAGEVEAVRGVTRWKVGDRVMGLVGGGAMAELLTVHEDEALPIPDSLGYEAAAAVPEAFLTAYDALVTRGRLAAGERVLVHAVGSGVGTAAAQIAKHLGATVLDLTKRGQAGPGDRVRSRCRHRHQPGAVPRPGGGPGERGAGCARRARAGGQSPGAGAAGPPVLLVSCRAAWPAPTSARSCGSGSR